MESFEQYLQQFPGFQPEEFERAKPFISERRLETGDYFLRHGTVSREVGFIQKGILRLFYLTEGKEITNCFCREGTIVTAYSSMISQAPTGIAIQAMEPCQILTLSTESLQELYASSPFWLQVGKMAGEQEYLISDCHNRLIQGHSASDRYLKIVKDDPELLQRVPLNYLASYLQITPETLSRIRKKISHT